MSTFKVGDQVTNNGKQTYAHATEGETVYVVAVVGGDIRLAKTKGGRAIGDSYEYPASHFELVKAEAPAIDWSKPVETMSGLPVTILTREARGPYPVLANVGQDPQYYSYTSEGSLYSGIESEYDLRNVVPKPLEQTTVHYENVYKTSDGKGLKGGGITYETRARADEKATSIRVGCIRVERKLVEGQYDA